MPKALPSTTPTPTPCPRHSSTTSKDAKNLKVEVVLGSELEEFTTYNMSFK
ncbi:hypothetical protein IMZ48_41735 [Candidatus Bathyarchaeota archaeon]|nr:hypothetical protein [Candidatus Bathyarchaeota archaeon]